MKLSERIEKIAKTVEVQRHVKTAYDEEKDKALLAKVKIVSVNGKTSDNCYVELKDVYGKTIASHDGYVPSFLPGGGGDYLELEIDINTGKILNWKVPTADNLQEEVAEEWEMNYE